MINPDGSPGDIIDLFSGENIIGRASDIEVFARDPHLSPQHANFIINGKQCRVVDMDSLNGVYYRVTTAIELHHGDLIRIGRELLRFEVLALSEMEFTSTDDSLIVGSNPMGAWGRLLRVSSPNSASHTFVLRGSEQVLGRERGDILFRDDGYVSGQHCRIFTENEKYFFEDLGSSNGSFLRIRGEYIMGHGSLLLMGEQPFRLHFIS